MTTAIVLSAGVYVLGIVPLSIAVLSVVLSGAYIGIAEWRR